MKVRRSQNSLIVKKNRLKYEKKLKQLEKFETKIEQNLETHKKSLTFFQENDNCPVCTQKIDEKFRDEKMRTRKKYNYKTRMKDLVKEKKYQNKNKKYLLYQDFRQDIRYEITDSQKVSSSLESLKNHSDQIQQDIDIITR